MSSFTLFLALRHIRRRALQSSLTVLGVAVGVMVLIAALSLTNGFIAQLIRSTLRATPHVTLSSLTGGTFVPDPALAERLRAHPEVVAVAPFIEGQALLARRADATRGIEGRQVFTQLLGIDPELQQAVLADLPVIGRQAEALAQARGLVLGSSLSRALGVWPGETVIAQNVNRPRQTFEVVDTFQVGNEFIDNLVSFVSIPELQAFLGREGEISGYHVRVRDPERASAVAAELAELSGLLGRSWQMIFRTLIEQLELQRALIAVVVFLIVLVAAMGIANILILTVAEKTQEIAILRAMGASERQILGIFTLEGLLLGGSGTLLGALLGLAVSLYFRFQPFPLPGELYFITQLPVDIRVWDVIWVCALSLVTSVIAGLLPARRASRLRPVEILR